jgi:pyruvate,orthophosphate dikinase
MFQLSTVYVNYFGIFCREAPALMTFGFSRDDAGKFLVPYVEKKILPTDPFETLDQVGVGWLMRMAVEKSKPVRPDIKLGICGEHGGDPESVKFCHRIGLNM